MTGQLYEPADRDFERRVHESYRSQGFMQQLGATMVSLSPGECRLSLMFSNDLSQQHGFIHGGVVASLADVSGGYAAYSLLPANQSNLTVEFKVNFLAPALGEGLEAEGRVIRLGRQLTTCLSHVYAISGQEQRRLCAVALATYVVVAARD